MNGWITSETTKSISGKSKYHNAPYLSIIKQRFRTSLILEIWYSASNTTVLCYMRGFSVSWASDLFTCSENVVQNVLLRFLAAAIKLRRVRRVEFIMKLHLSATGYHLPYGIMHSVACHPNKGTHFALTPARGRYSIYLPRRDGWLNWPKQHVLFRILSNQSFFCICIGLRKLIVSLCRYRWQHQLLVNGETKDWPTYFQRKHFIALQLQSKLPYCLYIPKKNPNVRSP